MVAGQCFKVKVTLSKGTFDNTIMYQLLFNRNFGGVFFFCLRPISFFRFKLVYGLLS